MTFENKDNVAQKRKSWSYVKDFVPHYKPYLGLFVLDMVCSLVAAGVEIIFPLFVEQITTEAIATGYLVLQTVIKYASILIGIRLVEIACRFFVAKYGHIMGVKIESDLRRNMFHHLQRMSHSFYDNQKVGTLMSRITTDLFDITEFAHHCPETLFIASIRIIGIFTILAMKDWRMTVCLFVLTPFMAWLTIHFNNKWDDNYQKNR
ncbi:MAG TPA: ABC transporter transmembrane domain-containing protein, partial [Clostridia bacterium]|nr:ABC transporter transmembrane domain-containing protein [Clostridia bacterium]